MCFRHVPEQAEKELSNQIKGLVLIIHPSICAYKLYSPIEDKLVISKDGLVDERKQWDWSRSLVRQEDEQNEASTSQNEEVILRLVELKEKRSKRIE